MAKTITMGTTGMGCMGDLGVVSSFPTTCEGFVSVSRHTTINLKIFLVFSAFKELCDLIGDCMFRWFGG